MTIDLDHDLSDEEIEAGEKYANELVWKNAPVRIFNVDASELPNLPLRKKNEKLHGEVRIVEVEDGDHTEMCTCCGTHFMSTAPVGLIKVLEHMRYKSGCRITFACGVLALEHFTKENAELRRTCAFRKAGRRVRRARPQGRTGAGPEPEAPREKRAACKIVQRKAACRSTGEFHCGIPAGRF